jgi:hypothetical protein
MLGLWVGWRGFSLFVTGIIESPTDDVHSGRGGSSTFASVVHEINLCGAHISVHHVIAPDARRDGQTHLVQPWIHHLDHLDGGVQREHPNVLQIAVRAVSSEETHRDFRHEFRPEFLQRVPHSLAVTQAIQQLQRRVHARDRGIGGRFSASFV